MDDSGNLDDEARAELLCYLVVAQLVALARTGGWLRTDHVVESLNIWLKGNGARAAWRDRLHLGALSEKVALDFAGFPECANSQSLARLFTDGWRMDYRSPFVGQIHSACKGELKEG